MKIEYRQARTQFARFLIIILAANWLLALPAPSRGQNRHPKPIVITADQPNVWTLEQAHYLLAQMHRRNLDLRAKGLEALDANEINGLRFDIFKSLLEVGANFNQADLVTNQLLAGNKRFNAERRQTLLGERDKLRQESLSLTRDITQLQIDRARTADTAEQARLDAAIAQRTAMRDKVDKEIEFKDGELKTLSEPTGDLKATEAEAAFDPNKLPKGLLDDAFKDTAKKLLDKFNEEPRLNATLRLENYLQMQYEIIAKQLTLLRDEVGPGERLIFLELPQSINVTHSEANKKWAQSWWKIVGYTINKIKITPHVGPDAGGTSVTIIGKRFSLETAVKFGGIAATDLKVVNSKEITVLTPPHAAGVVDVEVKNSGEDPVIIPKGFTYVAQASNPPPGDEPGVSILGAPTMVQEMNKAPRSTSQTYDKNLRKDKPAEPEAEIESDEPPPFESEFIDLDKVSATDELQEKLGNKLVNRQVRTIDLIPRQSSLNVNDLKLRTRAGALTAVASFLFGFGARVNYQRQREQFSQFVQQELYSSAFGKGSREFGWTFTAMPGMDRLMSGVRTTYAVVVVPENAASVVLETSGCYYPRSEYQPVDFENTKEQRWTDEHKTSRNCNNHKAFIVPIPGGGRNEDNNFYVKQLYYQPVGQGERIVLSILGRNFSSQLGVLIRGVPLAPALGLAQPFVRDDSATGVAVSQDFKNEKIRGAFERIDPNQVLVTFDMPSDFVGTPVITLVSPGRALDLNGLPLFINGNKVKKRKLEDKNTEKMFNAAAKPSPRIDKVVVFRSATPGNLTALISGDGFRISQPVFINGHRLPTNSYVSPSLLKADLKAPLDDTIQVTIGDGNKTISSQPVANPMHLKISNVAVVSYEAPTRKSRGVLVVRIIGLGFTDALETADGELVVQSPTEAILKITDPDAAEVITLKDKITGSEVKAIVARKPLP